MKLRQYLRSDAARGYLLVSPTALYALLLLAVPLAAIFAFSFWTQDYLTIDKTWTLKNYREALSEPLYRELMFRSVRISAAVTLATVLLAFPIAYFVSFHVPKERKSLWIFLITIPFWTSYLIRVFLWKVILGYNGVLNTTLQGVGIIDEPLTFILYNANAVVITLAHAFAPFAILPIFVALEKIDRSLLEASLDLGESKVTTFFRVTLPLAMPGVIAAVLIVFIPTIGDYVTPRLVGGPNGLMIANMIQTQFLKLNNAPMGATLAVLAMLIVTAISLVFVGLNRKFLRGQK
ncbi:ABC transporter permease [Actibacterium lipolyticum]|uniref:Spermidine/putrescine transport system permease protein PotB n=1 Tax=Actibacterium lipolyticum TaxID=1524263 RepID=A0A238JZA4_9RHOB|nr:ABC transporter permease [Actibacterium lipolyticum]SMX35192.1 Spermidine/putrescine transport system permease protein PotB [Actibacterium lipolyticum]